MESKSAIRLQEYINREIEENSYDGVECIRVYPDRHYIPRPNDLIVGWGSGNTPNWAGRASGTRWFNKSGDIAKAVNKLTAFQLFTAGNVPTVPYTTRARDVVEWYRAGSKAVLRQNLEGRDGDGVEIVPTIYDFWDKSAPLYTKFIPNTTEYRVHVFNNIIDIQQKRPRDNARTVNQEVRTTSGGWGLYRGNVNCPAVCQNAAIAAVRALGLSFGAVDVLATAHSAYVLEVNTAPELTEICTEKYGDTILQYVS